MAPSHMDQEFCSPDYTHKKFNCGYSHKKLGRRFLRRPSQDEALQKHEHFSNCNMDIETIRQSNCSPSLFRPYALGEDDESSNHSMDQEIEHEFESSPMSQDFAATCHHYYNHFFSQQQSADAYAPKLQRQRAALYMKYIMQYYENGNGWPTIHPKCLK